MLKSAAGACWVPAWFETRGFAALLTMRWIVDRIFFIGLILVDLILRSRPAWAGVSKDGRAL
jgi:hypothetical protein